MTKTVNTEALSNHPFFARVYRDQLKLDHSYQGKVWPIKEFLSNLYDMLLEFMNSKVTNLHDFYDEYLFNKYGLKRRNGHQYTLEFLISWIRYYQDYLEIRLIHLLSISSDFTSALKFLMKARKIATDINSQENYSSVSCDKIYFDKSKVVQFCDELFGPGSDSNKVWRWLQQENRHLIELKLNCQELDGVKLLSDHISSEEVSLSYLLEYVLKDFLPNRKRYINRLYDIEQRKKVQDSLSGVDNNMHNYNTVGSPIKKNRFSYYTGVPGVDDYMLQDRNASYYNFSPTRGYHVGTPNKVENYFSTPNLESYSPNRNQSNYSPNRNQSNYSPNRNQSRRPTPSKDYNYERQEKKRAVQEIIQMKKNMMAKKIGLVKVLSLCRIIDPLVTESKKKIIDHKLLYSRVLNSGMDKYTCAKIQNACGLTYFDPYDGDFAVKQNLYKELLSTIQTKGIKLAKDFRTYGIPYVQVLDNYLKSIERPIIQDSTLFRNDFPKNQPNDYASEGAKPRASPSRRPGYDTHPLYPDVQTPDGNINDFKTVNPSIYDSGVEYPGASYDLPKSRYENPKSRFKSNSKDRNRSVTPEMQDLDDDFLADNLKLYNDDDPNDFYIDFGDSEQKPNFNKQNVMQAANYDTNDLMSEPYNSRNDPRYNSRDTGRNDHRYNSRDTGRNDPRYNSRDTGRGDPSYNSRDTGRPEPRYNSRDTGRNDPRYDSRDTGNTGREDPRYDSRDTGREDPIYNSKDTGEVDPQQYNSHSKDTFKNDSNYNTNETGGNDPQQYNSHSKETEKDEKSVEGEDYIERMKKNKPPPPAPIKTAPPPPPKKEKVKKPKKKPEPIIKEAEVKIIEVPIEAPLPATNEVNLSCTSLVEEEKRQKEDQKAKKAMLFVSLFDMKVSAVKIDQETMAIEEPVEFKEIDIQTDDIVYEDKEMDCDKKEVFDKDCGGKPIESTDFKMVTDPIVKDIKECEVQSDPIEFIQITVNTDPEPEIEKNNKVMKTDPIPLKKKANLQIATDPEILIQRKEFKIETDPEPIIEYKEFNIMTDLEPAAARVDFIVMTDPWTEFETQDNENDVDPHLLDDLLDQARKEAQEEERERVRKAEAAKLSFAMLIKPIATVSSGMETEAPTIQNREMQTDAKELEEKGIMTEELPVKDANYQTTEIGMVDKNIETIKTETKDACIDQESEFEFNSARQKQPIVPQKIHDKEDFKKKEDFEQNVKDKMDKTSGVGKLKFETKEEEVKPMRKSGKKVIRESPFAKKNTQKDDKDDSKSTNSGFRRTKTGM